MSYYIRGIRSPVPVLIIYPSIDHTININIKIHARTTCIINYGCELRGHKLFAAGALAPA